MSNSPDEPFDVEAALGKLGIAPPPEVPAEEIFDKPIHANIDEHGNVVSRQPVPGIYFEAQIDEDEDDPFAALAREQPEPTGNPKDLMGAKKPPMAVVPPAGLLYLGAAMGEGARKYGPFNWRGNAVKATVYVEAMMRHCMQYLDGEDIDPESGVPHLGHIMASAAIVADATETGNLIDDRPKAGPAGNMIRRWSPEKKFHG